ncbi:MAG: putative polymerase subfamily sigma factor [Acidimicrobiales bacterium]|nr:putative polymerase subfamily sigma factor [Acidimicrobiales bacterium]
MGGEPRLSGEEDRASFEDLYRADYAAVVRLAFTLTGRRDVAEELAQEGFLAAHRHWESVGAYEDPSGWVRRVVTNRCVSSGRRHVTSLRLAARLARQRPEEPMLSEPAEELWAQVRALPKRQAQVVALAFLEDRSPSEIAKILGCGEETVRTHLRRGRRTLAERLTTEASTNERTG